MEFLEKFTFGQHILAGLFFVFFVLVEIILRYIKKKKRKDFDERRKSLESIDQIEDVSLEYYKELQHLDVIRFVTVFIGLLSVLTVYNIQIFNIIAVATGAFILALRESFASFFAYFYILSNFRLGDDLRVNGALGELVAIKPLYTSLAGKDDTGEYNSKLNHVPNFMFLNQTVERQQLKSDDYRKLSLTILYNRELYTDDFATWIEKIETYLESILPKRVATKVGYFRGYAGIRYKLNFDYNDDGDVIVKLSFITRSFKALSLKESIIYFVEKLKK